MEIILISKTTGRTLVTEMTGRQLLETNEDDLVYKMAECDCQPIGETNVIECNCAEEWEKGYTLIVGNENNYNNIDYGFVERV